MAKPGGQGPREGAVMAQQRIRKARTVRKDAESQKEPERRPEVRQDVWDRWFKER